MVDCVQTSPTALARYPACSPIRLGRAKPRTPSRLCGSPTSSRMYAHTCMTACLHCDHAVCRSCVARRQCLCRVSACHMRVACHMHVVTSVLPRLCRSASVAKSSSQRSSVVTTAATAARVSVACAARTTGSCRTSLPHTSAASADCATLCWLRRQRVVAMQRNRLLAAALLGRLRYQRLQWRHRVLMMRWRRPSPHRPALMAQLSLTTMCVGVFAFRRCSCAPAALTW